ncbi:hypothetical protein BROC_02420 [Candidatus Brocadiaceae bacterium]|nr:hypothetical protein BROC_02420 [Candidatus Brocadiaceae bacterium]
MNLSENTISIISLCIALLALGVSIGDFFLARRALKISEMEAEERNPNLIPYLIDGFVLAFKSYKIFAFYFSVSNRSSNSNAISQLDLKILYNQDDHNMGNLLFRHDKTFEQGLNLPSHASFSIPVEIGAHQTVTGWGLFKVTEKILENKTIDNYKILIRDSHDVGVQLNPILIQERLMDEK